MENRCAIFYWSESLSSFHHVPNEPRRASPANSSKPKLNSLTNHSVECFCFGFAAGTLGGPGPSADSLSYLYELLFFSPFRLLFQACYRSLSLVSNSFHFFPIYLRPETIQFSSRKRRLLQNFADFIQSNIVTKKKIEKTIL